MIVCGLEAMKTLSPNKLRTPYGWEICRNDSADHFLSALLFFVTQKNKKSGGKGKRGGAKNSASSAKTGANGTGDANNAPPTENKEASAVKGGDEVRPFTQLVHQRGRCSDERS